MSEATKSMVFRLPETLKTDFRVVLLKNGVNIQHTFEAFVESLIDFDRGEKPEALRNILKRAKILANGV